MLTNKEDADQQRRCWTEGTHEENTQQDADQQTTYWTEGTHEEHTQVGPKAPVKKTHNT
jgi:hypothetical protein